MKKKFLLGSLLGALVIGGIIYAADHIDAPAVTGPGNTSPGNDITDVYAFQSPADNSKMLFVLNTQGLMSPAVSATASFPSNVMYEINIDNTGDAKEDISYQFRFKTKVVNPNTFLYNTGPIDSSLRIVPVLHTRYYQSRCHGGGM